MINDEKISRLVAKRDAIEAQIKKRTAQAKEKERKATTKRLMTIGAMVEKAIGRKLVEEDYPTIQIIMEEFKKTEKGNENEQKS